ncbi:hypothetical protein [Acetobacter orientalis]|uniref:hypothetical protein n=1 Tax=Acetobacter orientalis TaxID=146474 RepID=UPI0039EAF8D9
MNTTTAPLSNNALDALKAFAQLNGRRWKTALLEAWERGKYYGVTPGQAAMLQEVRNLRSPKWLQDLDLSTDIPALCVQSRAARGLVSVFDKAKKHPLFSYRVKDGTGRTHVVPAAMVKPISNPMLADLPKDLKTLPALMCAEAP